MPSTIPTFKTALETRLKADAGIIADAVQVSWGHPYPDQPEWELVVIGDAHDSEQTPVGIGSTAREETYELDIIISVIVAPNTPQKTAEIRAYAIAAYVEASIIAWQSEASPFGGINGWSLVGSTPGKEALIVQGPEQKVTGREASVTVTVEVTARI